MKKHLATIKHEEITVECGMGMRPSFYEWIRSSWTVSPKTKSKANRARSGEVISADFDYKAQRAIIFSTALITECTFPAFDASSKEPAYLTIKWNPERLRHEKLTGERISAKTGTKTRKWLTSGFTFTLGDLPCDRVSKIDSFSLKQTVIEDRAGKTRTRTKQPGKLEVPNLKVTFSATDAGSWEDWFTSFVIDGKCTDSDELNGQITILGHDHKEVLGRIELSHVGIISLEPARYNAKKEKITRMAAELYVEEMKLNFNVVKSLSR
ncbi:MAG TPA: hypothetical protein DD706_16130 [Nitrospiraceae bacterium]|nr:hypothetical protein [Nitrospiraceae bacterium]